MNIRTHSLLATAVAAVFMLSGCEESPRETQQDIAETRQEQREEVMETRSEELAELRDERSDAAMYHKHMAGPPMKQLVNLSKGRRIFVMQCGFHAYMESWGLAVANPYFAKSDVQGRFTLTDVPPGTYWIWVSLVLAIVIIGLMTPMGRLYLNRIRAAVGVDVAGAGGHRQVEQGQRVTELDQRSDDGGALRQDRPAPGRDEGGRGQSGRRKSDGRVSFLLLASTQHLDKRPLLWRKQSALGQI